ncbi:MAG: hypothetical protein E6F99_16965 [Actinobacteria bacterium]|nr:MAG: hypothetical protein E6F99_16965 [Actinomycetota bacterium]
MDVDQTSPGVPSAGLVGAFMLLFVCLGGVTFLAAAVPLVIVVTRRGRARRERMRQWMAQYGWTMTESPAVDWGNRLPGQNPGGVSRIICGTLWGRPVCVGDYSYTYRALADNTGRRGPAGVRGGRGTAGRAWPHHRGGASRRVLQARPDAGRRG